MNAIDETWGFVTVIILKSFVVERMSSSHVWGNQLRLVGLSSSQAK